MQPLPKILILDDDRELGEMLRDFITQTCHCEVTYLSHEDDFWPQIEQQRYDLLLLDYKLNTITGLSILEALKERQISLPTIMMTGEGSEQVAVKAIQAGALDYLVKGEMSFDLLPAVITKALSFGQLQREMRRSQEQVRYHAMLLDNMRDAVVVWTAQGEITYWNKTAEDLYGISAAEAVGAAVQTVYFPLFSPPLQWEALTPGQRLVDERSFTGASGIKLWISSQLSPLQGEAAGGSPTGWMDVTRDVTNRKVDQETLVNSQHLIQRILDTVPNLIYIIDVAGARVKYVSQNSRSITGDDWVDLVNIQFADLLARIHSDDAPRMRAHFSALVEDKESEALNIDFRYLDTTHQYRWLRARNSTFSRGPDGRVSEVIGICSDVTQFKQAETDLRNRLNSEELATNISGRFINLNEETAGQDIIWALKTVMYFGQAEFGMLFLNHKGALERVYEAYASDSQHPAPQSVPLEFSADALSRLKERSERDEQYYLANLAEPASPGRLWVTRLVQAPGVISLVLQPLYYQGEVYGALLFGTYSHSMPWANYLEYLTKDFSQALVKGLVQLDYDREVRQREAQYRAIVEDHQTELICRFTPQITTLIFVNEPFCQFFGRPREELLGVPLIDLIPDEDREEFCLALDTIGAENPVASAEHRLTLPGQKTRWQEWVLRAIPVGEQSVAEIQGVGRDITERKEMEERIRLVQTRLAQSTRLASIGQLASSVAHQISNPLTTIIGDAQILMHELPRDMEARESAQAIIDAGWRVQQVVDALMKFSQPENRTQETVDINETITKAILLAGPHVQSAQIELHTELDGSLPPLAGHSRQLIDLWVNLLLAARSGPESATRNIWVKSCQGNDNAIEVTVTDDGMPIPAEEQELIFEPQLLPAGQGRGLGMELSLCREIVRQHDGSICAESDQDRTVFRIVFPNRS